jgi:hypothetical protein
MPQMVQSPSRLLFHAQPLDRFSLLALQTRAGQFKLKWRQNNQSGIERLGIGSLTEDVLERGFARIGKKAGDRLGNG